MCSYTRKILVEELAEEIKNLQTDDLYDLEMLLDCYIGKYIDYYTLSEGIDEI